MSYLKSHKTTEGDFLHFSFHTLQKCADKNWSVFSETHFKPDLHIPSLLSSSVLSCCSNTKNLLTDSFVCLKHPLASMPFQKSASSKEAFPEVTESSPSPSWALIKEKSNHFPVTHASRPLVSSISQPVVLKIRHSPWWWGVSKLLGAFWTDCGMIYYTSPPGRGKKGSDLHPQRKYGNYSSEALKKEENSSMIFQLSVIATTHSLSMTQNEHTHAPRVGTIVRCQGLASGYGRNLFHCPLWFWSATIFL